MRLRSILWLRLILLCGLSILGVVGCATTQSADLPPLIPPTDRELDDLVAPIALYPDPLLQRVLTAATFPDQLVDAALFIEEGGAPIEIPHKSWERSVRYVANYPKVLTAMAEDIDRTIRLGTAFTDRPDRVRERIQRFRREARAHENLTTTPGIIVIEEGSGADATIRIEPTDPAVILIPTPTTTTIVYERPLEDPLTLWTPLASFGLGVALAAAIDPDDFYYYGGPFYGPGFWYGGPVYRRWYDYRHDRWHHAYDYGRWHHEYPHHREEWRQHRTDLARRHSAWRHAHTAHTARTAGGPFPPRPGEGRASFRPPPLGPERPGHRGLPGRNDRSSFGGAHPPVGHRGGSSSSGHRVSGHGSSRHSFSSPSPTGHGRGGHR